jgi:hypothetical protein
MAVGGTGARAGGRSRPPGEQRPLACFGLILRSRGWRHIYLGAETPPSTVHMAADTVGADVVVMSAVSSERFSAIAKGLRALARGLPLVLAGPGRLPNSPHSSRCSACTTPRRRRPKRSHAAS